MSSSKKVINGLMWTTLQTFINRIFGFFLKLFLARLLLPEDYGLIGMAVVFTSFMQVFNDLGFGAALIQRKKEKLTEDYFSTAFWTGLVWSLIVFLIITFIIAPLAASFYDQEILRKLVPVLSLSILGTPLIVIPRIQLTKNLDFKKLALINNVSGISAGIIAIILAYFGAGVWSLAFNSFAVVFIAIPLYFKYNYWLPKFIWRKKCFNDMFGFGVFTTLSNLVYKISSHGDYLLIGRMLGKFELGLYSFAFILTDSLRSQIKNVLDSVLFPIYSERQDDKAAQINIYMKNIFFNALIITPIMICLFYSTELVTVLFGEKWEGSIIIVQIISLSVIIDSLTVSYPSVMRANDKTNLEFKSHAIGVFLIFLPALYFGISLYGILGAAIAVLINRFFMTSIQLMIMYKYLQYPAIKILKNFTQGLLPSVLGLVVTYFIYQLILANLDLIDVPKEGLVVLKAVLLGITTALFTFVFYKKRILEIYRLYKN